MSASPRTRAGLRNPRQIQANINALDARYVNAETNYFFGNSRYAPGEWQRYVKGYEAAKNQLQKELVRSLKAPRAAKIIQRKFKQVYYAPHRQSPAKRNTFTRSPLRGRGYRRTAKSVLKRTMSPKSRAEANLKNQLERMLSAYQAKRNRGTLRNMFNTMQNTWRNTGYSKKGAGYMNAAQMIMATYGFI
jgi:hypothetical protein